MCAFLLETILELSFTINFHQLSFNFLQSNFLNKKSILYSKILDFIIFSFCKERLNELEYIVLCSFFNNLLELLFLKFIFLSLAGLISRNGKMTQLFFYI